jgi:capsid protein
MTRGQTASPPPRVASKADAEALTADVLACLADLERVLEAETAHVRAGRVREGLADEARKGELSARYVRGLETLKSNAVALARFAPDRLDALKSAHARFAKVVEANQVVLATARAVSESLVKGIAEELGRGQRAQGYAPAGYGAPQPRSPQGEPLVVSRSL